MTKGIIDLKDSIELPASIIGGKAKNAANLLMHGFNIPNGFIITESYFQKKTNLYKDKILQMFDNLGAKYVAVRSSADVEDSATHSFAGQFETFLNIDRENIIENIEKCFLSKDSKRIKEYCKINNINESDIHLAVLIQEMINPDVSGVAFTIDPVFGNPNNIIIEAVWGLGEGLVSGEISPDRYTISKDSLRIVNKIITKQEFAYTGNQLKSIETSMQEKQKLSDNVIIEVAKSSRRIEKLYQKPQDAEWCLSVGKLFFLQTRPITT